MTDLKDKTIQIALKIGAYFLVSSLLGVLAGKFLDNQFDIAPYGSLGVLGVMYALTWVVVIFFNPFMSTKKSKVNSKSDSDKETKK